MEDRIIYHYCKMQSFFNIIKERQIWLSNAFKTNDYYELKWVLEVLELPDIDTDLDSFKREYEDWIKTIFRPHISCFSLNNDVLSQWRGYADDGKGVAIGFSQKYFEEISQIHNQEITIKDVVYSRDKQKAMLQKFLKKLDIELFHKINKDFLGISSMVLASEIVELGLIFKHHSFQEEEEVRVIYGNGTLFPESDSIHYRPTDNNLISYIKLPLNCTEYGSPIKEIILGPKNQADEKDIEEFVQSIYGVDKEFRVKRSESSYR